MPLPLTARNCCLSEHDREVLDSIFNPLELTSSVAQTQAKPIDAQTDAINLEDAEEDAFDSNNKRARELEMAAVQLAENGELNAALEKFTAALNVESESKRKNALILNNRAQALRLAGRDDEAMADLNAAIELCGEKLLKTKCIALCQRGVLWRKSENLDAARRDFEAAASLGSQFAKTQLVEINPFAALCNQMLRQAFEQLK